MQYVLPSGPQAFTLKCLCVTSHKPKAPVRWRDGILTLDSLLDINHALLISIFCAKLVHISFLNPTSSFLLPTYKGLQTPAVIFLHACNRKLSNFIRRWSTGQVHDRGPRHPVQPSCTPLQLGVVFFSPCVVKSRYCDCIPFQLSSNHLIPINLITAGRDGK